MKWITHQCMALMGAFALGLPLPALVASCVGAVAPDALDMRRAAKAFFRRRAFNQIHRGTSHWPGWWILLWMLAQAGIMGSLPGSLLTGFSLGAVSHTFLDMCTDRGVPLLPSGEKRLSLRICSTGSLAEYAILAMTMLIFWLAVGQSRFLPAVQNL